MTLFDLSVLALPVQLEESLIEQTRRKYTVDGKRGLPPHVSLVYPFVRNLDEYRELKPQLQAIFDLPAISLTLTSLEKDEQRCLLYLKPEPNPVLEQWILDCYQVWGQKQPDVFLHLTIAKTANLELLDRIEEEIGKPIRKQLPVTVKIPAVDFWAENQKKWTLIDRLSLSTG